MKDDSQIDLAIIICTFQREERLRGALASVIAQSRPQGLRLTVIVVDNSDDGSAASVVELANRESPFEIRWIEAHPPNLGGAQRRRPGGRRALCRLYR